MKKKSAWLNLSNRELKKIDGDKQGRTKTKTCSLANIAFKCNFYDGGRSEIQIGYNGACSDDIIILILRNVLGAVLKIVHAVNI